MMTNWPTEEGKFKQWLQENADEALKNVGLRKGQTILDYGCGPGTFTIPAAGIIGSRGNVSALDTDIEALTDLRRKADSEGLRNIETILTDKSSPSVSLPRSKFDVILLYDVLQLVDDKPSLVKTLHTALKPGGTLSVFPMHVGVDEMLELAEKKDLFRLQKKWGMLLNFSIRGKSQTERGKSMQKE